MNDDQLSFDLTAPAPPRARSPKPSAPLAAPVPQPAETTLTVSQLTRAVREILESGLGEVWVEGEISNFRRQSSGHCYFTLKDSGAQLSCVLFARTAAGLRDLPLSDGARVELQGGITVYEARGQYQLVVKKGRAMGTGHLHARFEALKKKLDAEGLFDPARKKNLPRFPSRVGVVTSPTGAAIRDFLHVLHRRHPGIAVVINPVRVQGDGAAEEIARAIREFSSWEKMPAVDVVVLTRGGGSLEDLWAFNEEVVARAIAGCPIPIVSAVGHEIDFTISDFVADFRAPTPSAAAEILSADSGELVARLSRESRRMSVAALSAWQQATLRLSAAAASQLFREPARRVRELAQQSDRLWDDMARATREAARSAGERLRSAALRLDPRTYAAELKHSRLAAESALSRMHTAARHAVSSTGARVHGLAGQLSALDPHATLQRGYTITLDAKGRPLDSITKVTPGEKITTRFRDGESDAEVTDCRPLETSS